MSTNHEYLTQMRINKILQDQKDLNDELQLIHTVLFQKYVTHLKVNSKRGIYLEQYKYLTKKQLVEYLEFTLKLQFHKLSVKPKFTLEFVNDILLLTRIE